MNSIAFTLGAFIVALVILITVHEFGHFWMARKLGVKVLRFSLGFGKPLFRYQGKKGTEYVLSIFPLGGYVKMLDERQGDVAEEEKHLAFNRQSLPIRTAIVLAGPIFNVLFAIVAYWGMYVIGVESLVPVIGTVAPNSIAAKAGLKSDQVITQVGQKDTYNWTHVRLALIRAVGNKKPLSMTTRPLKGEDQTQHSLDLSQWQVDPQYPQPLKSIGIEIKVPSIPPIIAQVMADKPGAKAGLKSGDRLVKVNGVAIKDWNQFVKYIRVRPQAEHKLEIERDNKRLSFNIKPEKGLIGIQSQPVAWPKELVSSEKYSWFSAWWPALKQLYDMIILTFVMLGKLILGKLSLQTLSGPVGIAIGAGQSAGVGFTYYLNFLGLVSVSLAVLNILPLPVLDGGHLLYFVVEAFRGKPISEKAEDIGIKIGVALLLLLMVVALYNDVMRLIG